MILLTGATGFVGAAIAQELAAADTEFVALVRATSVTGQLKKLAKELRIGDVNDPESLLDAFAGIDTIIHTAALVSFQPEDRTALLKTNGEGTANVVNMALEAGVRRLIHLSSVAALNRRDGGPLVGLADHWPERLPNTSYGESKLAAEREVWRGQAEGLEISVLYPSLILGAGDFSGHNTAALWRMAAGERGFYPLGTTGLVALEDVVKAVLFTLDHDEDGTRFILNAANWSWQKLLTAIAESINVNPPSRAVPAWQSALLWPVEKLRAKLAGARPLITKESHRNVQARFRYDGSAFETATGIAYQPIEMTIKKIGKTFLETLNK